MPEFGIQTTSVSLVLGSRGIEIDEAGRIRFVDPEILQALVSGVRPDVRPEAAEGNTIQCGCNNYQCGKGMEPQVQVDLPAGKPGP